MASGGGSARRGGVKVKSFSLSCSRLKRCCQEVARDGQWRWLEVASGDGPAILEGVKVKSSSLSGSRDGWKRPAEKASGDGSARRAGVKVKSFSLSSIIEQCCREVAGDGQQSWLEMSSGDGSVRTERGESDIFFTF